jgi:hypothetical protein
MTPADKNEFSQMISSLLQLHTSETNNKLNELNGKIDVRDAQFNGALDLIKFKLESIEAQTKKTNGRVNKLEEDTYDIEEKLNNQMKNIDKSIEVLRTNDIEHVLHCPNVARIKVIEDTQLTTKSIYKFIGVLIGGLSTLTLLILTALQIFVKK